LFLFVFFDLNGNFSKGDHGSNTAAVNTLFNLKNNHEATALHLENEENRHRCINSFIFFAPSWSIVLLFISYLSHCFYNTLVVSHHTLQLKKVRNNRRSYFVITLRMIEWLFTKNSNACCR